MHINSRTIHALTRGVLVIFLLSFPSIASAAKPKLSKVDIRYVDTREDGMAIVVTCSAPLRPETLSPALKAYALDENGAVIARQISHGGRHYRPELYSRLDRQAVRAATASPTSVTVGDDGNHIYQFVFFDIADTFHRVVFTPPLPPEKRPQVQQKKRSQNVVPLPAVSEVRKPYAPRSTESPGLVSGRTPLAFEEQPNIRSFLEEELKRFRDRDRLSTAPPAAEQAKPKNTSKAHAVKALEPYGIFPLWEYLAMGTKPSKINELIESSFPHGKQGNATAMACAMNICEYALKLRPRDRSIYRLYFDRNALKSIVVEISERDMAQRMAILSTLKSVYGGTLWKRPKGPGIGHSVSKAEYIAELQNARIETHGKYIRVFEKK